MTVSDARYQIVSSEYVVSGQAELGASGAAEGRPDGHSGLKPNSDGLAVRRLGLRSVVFHLADTRQLPIVMVRAKI